MKRIAILGGSFNPIHNAHIKAGEYCINQLDIDEVWYIPVYRNPFKSKSNIKSKDRLKMVQIAIEENPKFKVLNIELKSKGRTYTINTLKKLTKKYSHHIFYLIIGEDQIENFHKWHNYELLDKYAQIVVFRRPNSQNTNNEKLKKIKFIYLNNEFLNISSTELRQSMNVNHMNPKVVNYINSKFLYAEERMKAQMSEERYQHSLRVAKICKKINKKKEWSKIIYFAGLFHDITKEWNKNDHIKILEKDNQTELLKENPSVYHAYTGAKFIDTGLGWKNELVVSAIKKHTMADIQMNEFDMILYIADKIDPDKNISALPTIKKALRKSIHDAFIETVRYTEENLKKRNIEITEYQQKIFDHWLRRK